MVNSLKLHEAHDILAAMKNFIEEDGGVRAKAILDAHPQLVPALAQMQSRLGMAVPQYLLESTPAVEGTNPLGINEEAGQQHHPMMHQV